MRAAARKQRRVSPLLILRQAPARVIACVRARSKVCAQIRAVCTRTSGHAQEGAHPPAAHQSRQRTRARPKAPATLQGLKDEAPGALRRLYWGPGPQPPECATRAPSIDPAARPGPCAQARPRPDHAARPQSFTLPCTAVSGESPASAAGAGRSGGFCELAPGHRPALPLRLAPVSGLSFGRASRCARPTQTRPEILICTHPEKLICQHA